jgi:hypothetical protein
LSALRTSTSSALMLLSMLTLVMSNIGAVV